MRYIILVALALSIPLNAQPVVNPGGVLNTASFIVDGLPNSGIAQGSMFAVFGQNLGPGNLVPAAELPLPTELAGTSMEVTVNGTDVTPFLIFTLSGQLAGVLPSNTPVGQGTLTVTFNGETSEPVAIEVVKSAFGMFTRNEAGFGPAIVQNFVSATEAPTNALTEAAAPGQAEILWGSGLGPITESDANLPPVGNLPVEVEVLVGGISVTPFYAGRSPQFPAVDQINFFVPAGIEGCYVPLAVKVDGVVSNYGTMAVASEGTICSDATSFSAADLQTALGQGEAKIGTIELTRFRGMIVFPEAGLLDVFGTEGEGAFNRFPIASLLALNGPGMLSPALGTCVAYSMPEPEGFEFLPADPIRTPALLMDAGAALNLTGPLGTKELPRDEGPFPFYENELDSVGIPGEDEIPEFVVPGPYTVDNGGGGSEVGPFQASLNLPTSLTWSNRDSIPDGIPRSEDVTVTWTGGDPDTQFVMILGHSLHPAAVEGSFVCTERVEAGRFTVPSTVLSSLPATREWTSDQESPTGSLSVGTEPTAGAARFTAPGIDWGYFTYLDLELKVIRYGQVMCGDIITSPAELTGNLTCTGDAGPAALTVIGPGGKLDLNGFTLDCDNGTDATDTDGIRLTGSKARVHSGIVRDCTDGVVLSGTGNHQVANITSEDHVRHGFLVTSNRNELVANTAQRSATDDGFNVNADDNHFVANLADDNANRGFEIRGDRNKFSGNTASNNHDGFVVQGARDHDSVFTGNTALNHIKGGVEVRGRPCQLTRNTVDGASTGFDVLHTRGCRLEGNIVRNAFTGILLRDDLAQDNRLEGNDVIGSVVFDLVDENVDCDNNEWTGNTFVTSNQACIN